VNKEMRTYLKIESVKRKNRGKGGGVTRFAERVGVPRDGILYESRFEMRIYERVTKCRENIVSNKTSSNPNCEACLPTVVTASMSFGGETPS